MMPLKDIVVPVEVAVWPENVTDHCVPSARPVSEKVTVEVVPPDAVKLAVIVPGPLTTAEVDALGAEAIKIDPDELVQKLKLYPSAGETEIVAELPALNHWLLEGVVVPAMTGFVAKATWYWVV